MPSPWNDATDRRLLLMIIHLTAPQAPKWDQVAAGMGANITAEAARQHFLKLRKESKAEFGEVEVSSTNSPAKGTPRKSAKKKAEKRKASTTTSEEDGDDKEDDTKDPSPTKKAKTTKMEEVEEEIKEEAANEVKDEAENEANDN